MAMSAARRKPGGKKPPRPLDRTRLEELAVAYVARFATSAGKLRDYLGRKLRERGWDGAEPPDPAGIVARFVDAGYIDDAGYARAKAGGLRSRGYGERRVEQALTLARIGEDHRAAARGEEHELRAAALVMVRKRRFGPFGPPFDGLDGRKRRERQLAAMLRAGHPLESARVLVDAASIEAAQAWASEGSEIDDGD